MESDKFTTPENPERLVALMIAVPELPLVMERLDGLALREKSGVPVFVKFASRMSSGITVPPFTTETQIESLLEPVQPTGNSM